MRNYLYFKIYATSEGVVSHNVLYYQQVSNARYTKSVFKFIFVLRNYQTCTFPLSKCFSRVKCFLIIPSKIAFLKMQYIINSCSVSQIETVWIPILKTTILRREILSLKMLYIINSCSDLTKT